MNLFTFIENILFYKSLEEYYKHISDPSFNSLFSNFMVLRYCSMTNSNKVNFIIAKDLKNIELLDQKILYLYLLKTLPKQKKHFLKYLK